MQPETTDWPDDRPTILIVDDDPAVGRIYSTMLTRSGYAVEVALTFHEAARLMTDRDFGALISDIVLGEKDGLDILKRSQRLQPDTPVILVTGLPDVQTAATAVHLNAYAYLEKPVSKETLLATVVRALQLKALRVEKKQVEEENRHYQHNLEALVAARTQKLNQSNQRYQLLFENSKDAIYMADRKGGLLAVNRSLIELCGYPREEIIGRGIDRLHVDPKCHRQLHLAIERDGFIKDFDVRLRRKDGKILECLVTAHLLTDGDGQIEGYQGILRDITEKKRLEAIAEAANLMENLGYIFSGIRHEIGNPLNSVKMALSVLSMNLDTYPRETIREFVDRSLNEISRVEYLLKALKNFSMFETPDVEPVQISAFMKTFKTLVEKDFGKKGIRIRLRLPAEEITVMTDPRAFHQVMLNLVTNAADALVDRERPGIDIETDREDGFVSVTVRDNGNGMTEAELKNAFKPFYTSKTKGTGLGLVIVKKMLSTMGSAIRIDSTLNQGTMVTMTLPLAQKGNR